MADKQHYTNIRAVLFDLDGTLTDTFHLWYEAVRELVRRHTGRELGEEQYREKWWGMDGRGKIRQLITDEPQALEQLYGELVDLLVEKIELVRPLPGAVEAMQSLAKLVPLGVISNGPLVFLRGQLRQVGMADLFAVEIADAEPKPSPAGILRACEALNLTPAEVVFVGDSRFDTQAAAAAECLCIIIPETADRGQALEELTAVLQGQRGAGDHYPSSKAEES
ncbi:MAG: HAD family hydrolase [Armatimonadetes bacterium]|nr:HAD family hydrolase [Armatimonadota bacterium]